MAYLRQPRAERQAIVPSKAPYLSARSSNLADHSRNQQDDYQCDHDVRAHVAIGDIVEMLYERIPRCAAQQRICIRDGKAER